MVDKTQQLDVNAIMGLLPHRSPFLFLEKLQNIHVGESAEGIKTVSMNEPFFQGHFPGHPVMPGVLLVEALAQTAGALVLYSLQTTGTDIAGYLVYFMSVDNARFRKPVMPGDVLSLRVKKLQHRSNIWRFQGRVFVQEALVAEATFMAMLSAPK